MSAPPANLSQVALPGTNVTVHIQSFWPFETFVPIDSGDYSSDCNDLV